MRARVKFANWRVKKPFVAVATLRHKLNAKLLIGLGVLSVAAVPAALSLQKEQQANAEQPVSRPAIPEPPKPPLAPLPKEEGGRPTTQRSSSKTQTDLSVETSGDPQKAAPKTEVNLNGNPVTVPKNGTVHKVMHGKNGTTTLNIQSNSRSSGTSETSSSTEVQVYTESLTESGDVP